MKINYSIRRAMTLFLAAAVLAAFMPLAGSGLSVHAAGKTMKLPKKMTIQKKDGGKWKKFRDVTFSFNKHGDVTKINSVFYGTKGQKKDQETITFKYKYKSGKKVSATAASSDYDDYRFKLDKSGRLAWVEDVGEYFVETHDYSYDNNGYLKSDHYFYDDHEDEAITKDIAYKTTLKGGVLKSIVKNGPNKKQEWTYYSNGGLKTAGSLKFSYKMKGAYVAAKTVRKGSETFRFQYKYSSTKAKKAKYWKNINNDERIIIAHVYDPLIFDDGDEEDDFDDDAPFIDE